MPDGGRCAGEILPSITIVFSRHELHYMTIGEGSADGIGAGRSLAPIAARNEIDASESSANSYITNYIQQTTLGITQHYHVS